MRAPMKPAVTTKPAVTMTSYHPTTRSVLL